MSRTFKHLKKSDRLKIESLLRAGVKPLKISKIIGVHNTTIYRERKRGSYIHTNSDLTEETRYSSDLAEQKYQSYLRAKGTDLKIGNDMKFAQFLEEMIAIKGYSPEATLLEIKNKNLKFDTQISKPTLYSYIDKGVFFSITNKNLPVKGQKRKKYKKIKVPKKISQGMSIEQRPKKIETREEFGHWEMDTVLGKRGISKHSLLVLTERKTRKEIILLLSKHIANEVVQAIDFLEECYGKLFQKIFKSITVDNGTEFSSSKELETSKKDGKKRTQIYYCHAYCSYERGSNENQNKLIRRKIPKGTDFDHFSKKDIQLIEDWINEYPRPMFQGENSKQRFEMELSLISA